MHSNTTVITPRSTTGSTAPPTPRRRSASARANSIASRRAPPSTRRAGCRPDSGGRAASCSVVPFDRGPAMNRAIANAAKYADKPVTQRRARINAAKREAERIFRELNREEGAAA